MNALWGNVDYCIGSFHDLLAVFGITYLTLLWGKVASSVVLVRKDLCPSAYEGNLVSRATGSIICQTKACLLLIEDIVGAVNNVSDWRVRLNALSCAIGALVGGSPR